MSSISKEASSEELFKSKAEFGKEVRKMGDEEEGDGHEIVFKHGIQVSLSNARKLTPAERDNLKKKQQNSEDSESLKDTTHIIETITLGPPIDAEQNFARMIGAKTENTPVVVRLPEDISKEDIAELNFLSAQAGLKNILWQRMLVTRMLFFKKMIRSIGKAIENVVKPVVKLVKKHGDLIFGVAGAIVGAVVGGIKGAKIGFQVGKLSGMRIKNVLNTCFPKDSL